MRGFSLVLTTVNVVYLVTGAAMAVAVAVSDDPYAGLALIPWIFGWPFLTLVAIGWAVLGWVRRELFVTRVSPRLRTATIISSVGAFLPMGLLLSWYLVTDVLPEWRM